MHAEVALFVGEARANFPARWRGPVLELGSFDMNGSSRDQFPLGTEYVGVDIHPGRGVDIVGVSHEAPAREGGWQVVISTQALEHDPHWRLTIDRAVEVVAPGGLVVLTAAAPPTAPHGLELWPDGYYGNLTEGDLVGALLESIARHGRQVGEYGKVTVPTPAEAPIACVWWAPDP